MIIKILDLVKEKFYRKFISKKLFKQLEYGDIILYRFNKVGIVNKLDINNKIIILINNNK